MHICDFCNNQSFKEEKSFSKRLGIEHTKYKIWKCKNCGLVCLFPLPTEEEIMNIYKGYADKKNRIEVEKKRKEFIYPLKLNKLKKYAPGNKLLDIGAGLGTFVYVARSFGFEAFGVEFEKEQCEKAKDLWGVELLNERIENICEYHKNFDVVNLNHVLEHVYSPKKLLNIIYDLLKPGGIALIEVPNEFNSIKVVMSFFKKHRDTQINPLHHLYFFSLTTIKNYINREKFEILEFNQFRPREKKIKSWEKIPKDIIRFLVQKSNFGIGNFFEVYIKKTISQNYS